MKLKLIKSWIDRTWKSHKKLIWWSRIGTTTMFSQKICACYGAYAIYGCLSPKILPKYNDPNPTEAAVQSIWLGKPSRVLYSLIWRRETQKDVSKTTIQNSTMYTQNNWNYETWKGCSSISLIFNFSQFLGNQNTAGIASLFFFSLGIEIAFLF